MTISKERIRDKYQIVWTEKRNSLNVSKLISIQKVCRINPKKEVLKIVMIDICYDFNLCGLLEFSLIYEQ